MRISRILFSLLLTTACFGQLGNVNLAPIDGMPFVDRNHKLGQGIVGMWLFNDRPLVLGTTRDLSSNGNHGSLAGDTHSVAGKFGNALDFDGVNDWVTVPDTDVLDLIADFTVSVFCRRTTTGTANTLVSKFSGGLGFGIWSTDKIYIAKSNSAFIGFSTVTITDSDWHHLVWTKAGSVHTIFLDAVDVTDTITPQTLTANANPLTFGAENSTLDFTGQISEVILYDRVLSASEIAWLHRDPFAMLKQQIIPVIVAGAPPAGEGRSQGIIIASIPFGLFGIAFAFERSGRKVA